MKVLKGLLVLIVFLVLGLVGIGFMLPNQAHVERSVTIEAPPAVVFTVLNGFRHFNQWSPWAELDPNTAYVYEGPVQGVGAKMSWTSAEQSVGSGSQEILESEPYQRIKLRLVFSGFDSDSTASYELKPEGQGTLLTWSNDTDFKGSLLGRYFGLMLDGMIGKDYENGLAALKAFAEGLPKADFSSQPIEVVETTAVPVAYVSAEAGPEVALATLEAAYDTLQAFLPVAGRTQAGAPIAITREYDETSGFWKFDAAIPLDAPCEPAEAGGVQCGQTYAGTALKTTHLGAPETSAASYYGLIAYQTAAGWETDGDPWEHYVTDRASVPETELRTDIYWPVK